MAGSRPQSWNRVLGLFSRAGVMTLQRWLDGWTLLRHAQNLKITTEIMILALFFVITTFLMGYTMSKHWSALKKGKRYGVSMGVGFAICQLAQLWEMIDKICTHSRPPINSLREALLPPVRQRLANNPPKGSPGENVMRGLRKMSVVNLPQAMASLWFHTFELLPVSPPTDYDSVLEEPHNIVHLTLAFTAALLCVALGVADFVLYIWVDDIFVKANKKLVTFHYLLEILCRMPPVVLFNMTYSRYYNYRPTWALLIGDVLITSSLLLVARLCQPRSSCCFSLNALCNKQTVTQFLYSLVISMILFFVNIVFFDPGMIFCHINQVHFYVKLVELFGMLLLVWTNMEGKGKYELPSYFLSTVNYVVSICAVGHALLVLWLVPRRRKFTTEAVMSGPSSVTPSFFPRSTTPVDLENQRRHLHQHQTLERIEEIFELLWLLSRASCGQNRAKVLHVVVEELWLLALSWDGAYSDSTGDTIYVEVDQQRKHTVTFSQAGREATTAKIEANRIFVIGTQAGVCSLCLKRQNARSGVFDGKRLCWQGGDVWERQCDNQIGVAASRATLRLMLPQLALALRWDVPFALGDNASRDQAGPLMHFLIKYSMISRKSDFMLDLHWSLYCLRFDVPLNSSTYRCALRHFKSYLSGSLVIDGGHEPTANGEFLRKTKQLLQNQSEIWRQSKQLFKQHSGRSSGGGAWIHRTEELRKGLLNWAYRGQRVQDETESDFDEQVAQNAISTKSIDLVNVPSEAGGERISMPIDPNVQFLGIVIDESEVIPSKQAPLMLTCRTRHVATLESVGGELPGTLTDPMQQPANTGAESREKYLIKCGDDLRQDQLMLQLMELMGFVWQERLPAETVRLLKLDLFRVLAITPNEGYVKCVPNAVPLTEALHASQGRLEDWLRWNNPESMSFDTVMDRFCGSVAASCVVTYVLGIGDRHLENICITREGFFFHIDFSFVLGDDPKPIAPPVRLPQQVAQALRRCDRLSQCFNLAGEAYIALRPFAGLFSSLLRLTAEAGGAGCKKLTQSAHLAIAGVRERLRVDQMDDERAAADFLCLVRESSEGLGSIFLDKVHAAGLFWR